jgi:hypothetical protein
MKSTDTRRNMVEQKGPTHVYYIEECLQKIPCYEINLCTIWVPMDHFLWTQTSIIHQQMDTNPSIKGPGNQPTFRL